MNKFLACTAALMMPLLGASQALAQTSTGMAPGSSTGMGPGSSSMAPSSTMTPPAGMAGTASSMASTAKVSATDKKFVMKAAQGGMAEVQTAQLALQKTQSDNVKQFAQTMIDDHTPNNAKLMQIASAKGITPPSEPDAAQQKMMSKLQGLSGNKFDTTYLKGQVTSHEAMLKVFENESKNGTDPELKAFADQTIPMIQKHITMAQTGKAGAS